MQPTLDLESVTQSTQLAQRFRDAGAQRRRGRGRHAPTIIEPKLVVMVKDYTLDFPILYFQVNASQTPFTTLHWSINAVYGQMNYIHQSTGFHVASPNGGAECQIMSFQHAASSSAVAEARLILQVSEEHPSTTRDIMTYVLSQGFHRYALHKNASGCLWWIQRLVFKLETDAHFLVPGSSDRLEKHIAALRVMAAAQNPCRWTVSGVRGHFLEDSLNGDE